MRLLVDSAQQFGRQDTIVVSQYFQVRGYKNCKKINSKMEWESGGGLKGGPGPSNIWKNKYKCVFYKYTG